MKILILCESLRINETSSGIGRSNFISALLQGGHDITCVYEKNFNYELTWLPGLKSSGFSFSYKDYFLEQHKVSLYLLYYLQGYSLNFSKKIKAWEYEIKKELSKNKFDMVITLASGSEFCSHMAMLRIKNHPLWIANFHDPFPLHLYPEPYNIKKRLPAVWLERKTRKIILKADFITFPSLRLKEWMTKYFPEINEKFFILPHVYTDLPNLPEQDGAAKVELDKTKFNILHSGTLLGPRNPKPLLEGYKLFLKNNPDALKDSILNIVGKVDKKHLNYESEYTLIEKNTNIISQRVSYANSIELIYDAACLVIIEADATYSPFLPGKMSIYISADKPILALTPKTSEISRLLGDDYPYLAENNDPVKISLLLEKLYKEWLINNNVRLNRNDLKDYISAKYLNEQISSLNLKK